MAALENKTDTSTNVGCVYEALCKRIARCIIENDNVLLKRVKSVIATNVLVNEELTKELNLYNTILSNNFQDRGVAKSFLNECIAHAKHINARKFNTQLQELIEAAGHVTNSDDLSEANTEIYKVLNEVFQYARAGSHSMAESANYFRNIDYLLTKLSSEQVVDESAGRKYPKMDQMVYECAVDRFNKKYETTLTESQKEIIHDFLMYRSSDRFRKSLLKRVKQISEQLQILKQNKKIENVDLLKKKVDEYYQAATKLKTENINNLMLNVCEMVELYDELKKYSNEQDAK